MDDNTLQTTTPEPTVPSPVVVDPTAPIPEPVEAPATAVPDILTQVATKISEARNILIALSADPSVDELSSAIGLSLYLDRLGKRATAIYSGITPNALEFLKPEETFEPTADTLQDFVIALNKEKADHLRYKLDGDYVKIFITPYRTRIAEEDLEFSYGDFNVDLVLALDVANGIDLDSALREHGRIMHDAVIINITTGKPGKFGEIEWSDTTASSVSEMIATLLYSTGAKIEKEEATAFLTGIVAATNRFATASTHPSTMRLSSRLMESGANQQLVAKNITPDVDNEILNIAGNPNSARQEDTDPTKLDIEHAGEEGVDETKVVDAVVSEKESSLLDELKAAEASLAQAGAEATPESREDLFKLEDNASSPDTVESETTKSPEAPTEPEVAEPSDAPEPEATEPSDISSEPEATTPSNASFDTLPDLPPVATPLDTPTVATPLDTPAGTTPDSSLDTLTQTTSDSSLDSPASPADSLPELDTPSEKVIAPSSDFSADSSSGTEDYGKLLEEALSEPGGSTEVNTPIMSSPGELTVPDAASPEAPDFNPALMSAPSVPSNPEINGVPSMNYMPLPGEEVLPPPPAPPIDFNSPVPSSDASNPSVATAMPFQTPVMSNLGHQPAMTDQVYTPQASDPSAFKIPGV